MKKKYIMKKTRTLCIACKKSKLIQKTDVDYYCPKCKQRFTRPTDSKELMPVD